MRRCTACYRFQPGRSPFCAYCGRSFDVRLCPRGHRSPRNVKFCSICGSADLSEATPPASLLHRASGIALYAFLLFSSGLVAVALGLSAVRQVDWSELQGGLIAIGLMAGFLYWTTTLLPGPVRRVGKAAGRQLLKSVKGKGKGDDCSRRRG